MAKYNKFKSARSGGQVFNDPIYGFIRIPNDLIYDLIDDPYFQRLRRISQMGLSYLVFPGAHHTRFHHALGCMYLMQTTIQALRFKQIEITEDEETGLLCAILLHDIGHGPFSHTMEHSIVEGVNHEHISLLFMEKLNKRFNGSLTTAIQIFKKEHPKTFLNQLVSSQLDIDRLDYLKRDSFYTGVAEGNINAERLITMLNVVDDKLVVEEKGIYSVEKFLMARRFMYWQVYLHKTSLAAEQLLIRIFTRAKELTKSGLELQCSEPLRFFLKNSIGKAEFNTEVLESFALLDDVDIISALKYWRNHSDFVLSELCAIIIDRKLPKVTISDHPKPIDEIDKILNGFAKANNLSKEEAAYFVFEGQISNRAYDLDEQRINISKKQGDIIDVTDTLDKMNLEALSKAVVKYYFCYPKSQLKTN
ncbi:HD domain-containing protein [Aurantibacter crassamenti]|uniref:HD domain-containing protein n=1 Tax=Aurantibacter crassamenti TaxID=1837375 RepID=UPI00193A1905|nr:HD domain-containing protein [Aurantibacter crassamenti]MBM1106984.1 HD domain-containing protein [Aurantibacter crassamenti]